MTRALAATTCLTLLVAGCAVGRRHGYDLATPRVAQRGTLKVAVAVIDERVGVTSGRKDPTFVGLSRGGWGNTFDVVTRSGQPLAAEFANAITRGLRAAGYRVKIFAAAPGTRPPVMAATLAKTGAKAAVLVQLTEWKSDTYNSTALIYDVTMEVLDAEGQVVGRTAIRDRDNLGGSFWDPGAHAEAAVPPVFERKLAALLNAPEIARALQTIGAPPPETPPADTPPAETPPAPTAPPSS